MSMLAQYPKEKGERSTNRSPNPIRRLTSQTNGYLQLAHPPPPLIHIDPNLPTHTRVPHIRFFRSPSDFGKLPNHFYVF